MAEFTTAPRDVVCPVCQSPIGQPCTQPTHSGRRPVAWYYSARAEMYAETKRLGGDK